MGIQSKENSSKKEKIRENMEEKKESAILRWEGISKSYGSIVALKHFSGAMHRGITGLLGPNGAGKTSFLKILISLLKADQGEIWFYDKKIDSKNTDYLKQIGYMPEYTALLPGHTPVSYLAFLGELEGMSRKEALYRAHEVLFYIGIGEERYRKMEELSYGQLQKVMLCQALTHDPEILLLDEPTTGLDPEGRREFLGMMKELANHYQKAILFSSHILEDVEEICEHLLVLHKGEKLFSGPIQNFHKERENLYLVQFWKFNPLFYSFLESQGISFTKKDKGALILHLPDSSHLDMILEGARQTQSLLKTIKPYHKPLEEIFVEFLEPQN